MGKNANKKSDTKEKSSEDKVSSEREMKFAPQAVIGKTKYASYATVREHLINSVQQQLDKGVDIADAILDGKLTDWDKNAPELQESDSTDPLIYKKETKKFETTYEKEVDRHIERKEKFRENLRITYTMIWDLCVKTMKTRLEEHPDFDEFPRNPISMLEAIKGAMHAPVRAQYPFVSLTDSLIRWINAKQKEDEDLVDFVRRVKQNFDVVKNTMGTSVLDQFVTTTKEYKEGDAATKLRLQAGAMEQWNAYVVMRGSDQNKYGSVTKGFVTQYSLGNNQYPTTVKGAMDVLSNHTFDQKHFQVQKDKREKEKKKKKDQKAASKDKTVTSFGQHEKVCYCCGKAGHMSPKCNKKNKIPKEKWYVHTVMQNAQQPKEESTGKSEKTKSSKSKKSEDEGWSGFQYDVCGFAADDDSVDSDDDGDVFVAGQDGTGKFEFLKDSFILDTGSTIGATIMNPNFVKNIRESTTPVTMSTNAGTKTMGMDADIEGFGTAKFDPDQMANIFGFSHMVDQYRITYDSDAEDAFVVHTRHGPKKFARRERLYCYTPSQRYLDEVAEAADDENESSSSDDSSCYEVISSDNSDSSSSDDDTSVSDNSISDTDSDDTETDDESFDEFFEFDTANDEIVQIFNVEDSGVEADDEGSDSENEDSDAEDSDGERIYDAKIQSHNDTSVIHNHNILSVKENLAGFTAREIEQAKRARELYHAVGAPTVQNFKGILRMNIIQDCPVTADDVNLAERIYGPDVATLKGRTVRIQPPVVREDNIEIPSELIRTFKDLTYCMDIMYVNGIPMLTGLDKTVKYRALVPLKNKKAKQLYAGLDKILRHYNAAGFTVSKLRCDQEFEKIMENVCDNLDIQLHCPPRGDHVSEAERNNRVIGERIRIAYHRLPYTMIPRVMWQNLAMLCTSQLNYFPVKGGVSKTYSPFMIMKKSKLHYRKHCVTTFGTYVQVNHTNEPTNDNRPRTIDAIYMRPSPYDQGGHIVMSLATGQAITRQRVWRVPITKNVVDAVEAMAAKQKMKGLKLLGRDKRPLLPADWVAGVDYYEYKSDEEFDDDETYVHPGSDSDDDSSDASDESSDTADVESVVESDADSENGADPAPDNDGDEVPDDSNDKIDAIAQDDIDEMLEDENPSPEEKSNPDSGSNRSAQDDDDDQSSVEGIEQPIENPHPDNQHQPHMIPSETPESEVASRPTRDRREPERLTYAQAAKSKPMDLREYEKLEACHNLLVSDNVGCATREYDYTRAMLIARLMTDVNSRVTTTGKPFMRVYGQQYVLQKGLKLFGERGQAGAEKELEQLHKRECFTPIDISKLTDSERKKAMSAIMLLTEKRDKTVKGRLVYNGKPTRAWYEREDAASPTVASESIFILAAIDAAEERDTLSADVPNAFIQAKMPKVKKGQDRVIMKITGVLVDLLVKLAPELYKDKVVIENGKRVLYVIVIQALYGMILAALLWYKRLRTDLEKIGFKFNPYDPCVANRKVRKKQQTIRFHVDDLKSSHEDPEVNDMFLSWLNKMYGTHGEVKATRGKVHDYLGMTFDYTEKGKVKVDMSEYVTKMVSEFKEKYKLDHTAATPAGNDLFVQGAGEVLSGEQKDDFHTFVAKGLFACKRARPDIQPAIAVLTTRVAEPTTDDWKKLVRVMKYLNGSKEDVLTLRVDDLHTIRWHVDASFAVHPDFKSHTGAVMTMGSGAIQSSSCKQKLNTRSSCEAELVAADDMSTKILWTKLFMEAQGYNIRNNILFQDNKSTMLLLKNGKRSSGKRTRALNIRYFFLTDQIEKGNLSVEYCPTGDMVGDFMTKPKQGRDFDKFRKAIMGSG